ncbi:hypothetical protein ST47_g3274 [Ascochyta rabiei]|uniref:Uncharacterized protein n=1 Tax=Didymella rabiei TaxID=5454 RepID=A0A163I5D1_DIDRA|nr:hypothetical protein ST47_g3274 [Ascochyta rabiei]
MAAAGTAFSLLCWFRLSEDAVGAELFVIVTWLVGLAIDATRTVVAIGGIVVLITGLDEVGVEVAIEVDAFRLGADCSQVTALAVLSHQILTTFVRCHVLVCWTSNTRIACLDQTAPYEAFVTTVEDTAIRAASIPLQNSRIHLLNEGGIMKENGKYRGVNSDLSEMKSRGDILRRKQQA